MLPGGGVWFSNPPTSWGAFGQSPHWFTVPHMVSGGISEMSMQERLLQPGRGVVEGVHLSQAVGGCDGAGRVVQRQAHGFFKRVAERQV